MEKELIKIIENKQGNQENQENFHKIFKERLELKKVAKELGLDLNTLKETKNTPEGRIFDMYYGSDFEQLDKRASAFRISDFGEKGSHLKESIKTIKKQKALYDEQLGENERKILKDQAQIDYKKIFAECGELKEILNIKNAISVLKDFRMKRMFEILDPKVEETIKNKNEKILKSIQMEIEGSENKLRAEDQILVRQAELLEYKQNLSESGHICVVPSVAKDLEAIGDRMLTGKPVFLHGPTGTGKTSLARFAATHFTGKDPEMIFCNPQTKESNVWGKTGIRPTSSGAIETVEIYGPLAKAMVEGRTVIFDEFTALPKEQMVFIKAVFNAKVGDTINIVGNGVVKIQPGFQMIFTANLKSEKNPERQDLPPEIAREFEQNNIKINYIDKEEAYDVMIARMLNKDGSLDMSFHDINTTFPNFVQVMSEIQESYTNVTDKEVARKAGALDASGKVHSLKKFVMTQGSVEAIISSWVIEKTMKRTGKSLAEFIDERFKTALTFEEYPKEDRILVAKILASRGFLLTLTPKELNLPDDVFAFNTIKAMRGEDAMRELKIESGNIKHLSLKEVSDFDPFNKRAAFMKKQAEDLLSNEDEGQDSFSISTRKRLNKIFSKKSSAETIEITHKTELISLNFEQKLQEFISFYRKHNLDLPLDFEDSMRAIWENNIDGIQQAIEENGFDDILLMPGDMPLSDLNSKMTEGYNATYESDNFKQGGSFAGAKSHNTDKPRIVLVHKVQNLKDHPELKKTLNIKGQDLNKDHILTLEDYLIFQKKYFEETGKHLDEDGWTWLATGSGARLVRAAWNLSGGQVYVGAGDLDFQYGPLGARSSCSFF